MESDGLRFRQVVAIEDDNQIVSSSLGAAIHSPITGDSRSSPLLTPESDPDHGHSRASACGVHWTPTPSSHPPHSPFSSSFNHWESAISVYDRSLEERNCNCPSPNPLTSPALGLEPGPAFRDGAPGQVTAPPPSRASPDLAGLVTGDHPSPSPFDATVEERQRIFGHNVFPPRLNRSHPSEVHLVLKEITLAIVSTCRPSIHTDLPIQP